jgi:hypothetical protein
VLPDLFLPQNIREHLGQNASFTFSQSYFFDAPNLIPTLKVSLVEMLDPMLSIFALS